MDREQVVITAEHVRAALNQMIYSTAQELPNPLENLWIVQQAAAQAPHSPHRTRFVLQELLTEIIREELSECRRIHGLEPPKARSSLAEIEEAIQLDGQTGNPVLIGWSWLYYRYVRDDLALLQRDYAANAIIEDRTLRRYQEYALTLLVRKLYQLECEARITFNRARLYRQLPVYTPVKLVGRAEAEQQWRRMLANLQPIHVQITGPAGCGKTTFAQEMVRQLIDQERVDQLLWLTSPPSLEAIQQQLDASLPHPITHRTAVVLDGLDNLRGRTNDVQMLLNTLAPAVVLLINATYLPLPETPARIRLDDLEANAAMTLIGSLLQASYPEEQFSEDELWAIWNAGGGNPGNIKQMVQAFHQLFP